MPIPEVSLPTAECPEPKLWNCFDEQSAEVEVLDLLYQLVRTIKPKLIVETGTHRGLSACYMAKALRDNGRGKLISCEIHSGLAEKARELLFKAGLTDWAEVRCQSSLELVIDEPIDLLFADSLPELRMQEIEYFWHLLSPRSVILVHDVNSGWWVKLRAQLIQADKDRKLSVVLFPTPRGLALCQKRADRT